MEFKEEEDEYIRGVVRGKARRSSSSIKCKRCGEYFVADSPTTLYCINCYVENKLERQRKLYYKNRKLKKKKTLTNRKS